MTIHEGFSWLLKLRSVYTSLVIHVAILTFSTIIIAIADGIVTMLQAWRSMVWFLARGKKCFSCSKRPYRPWVPYSLLFSGRWRFFCWE